MGKPLNSMSRRARAKNGIGRKVAEKASDFSGASIFQGLFSLLFGFLITTVLLNSSFFATSADQNAAKTPYVKYHSSVFGGINNIAQPAGARAYADGQGIHNQDFDIPSDNLGIHVQSIQRQNILNLFGQYLHDEHRSPYASYLYDMPKSELDQIQQKFEQKMEKVRQDWGAWTDVEDQERPLVDYSGVDLRDLPNGEFPMDAWQLDEEYVAKFIQEAKGLVDRVTEGIYAEYGFPIRTAPNAPLSDEDKQKIYDQFQVHVVETNNGDNVDPRPSNGVAWLTKPAMDGLVRKLLHAMISNDEFYVVLAGHSAAAGHGNNFHQSKVLSMHYLMEPVFDKLGVRLISRNMAMGGVGTLHFSLAGKSLYGEADMMMWDSGMTENGDTVDFFNKQAILAGARMPILFTDKRFDIMRETEGTAWVGNFRTSTDSLPLTEDEVQAAQVPWAARYMRSDGGRLGNTEKYNAICWENRKDVKPDATQDDRVGSQVSWHPGFRAHQWAGRIYALVLLEGLKQALSTWEDGILKDGFPLAESYWHVGDAYNTVREKLRTHVNTPQENKEDSEPRSACEKFAAHVPRICRLAMQGYGMWHPRNYGRNLLDIVKAAPNGWKPYYTNTQQFTSFDLLPHAQAVPDGEVDVHAIAIATNNQAPELNHTYSEDGELPGGAPSRRWLRAMSEKALQKSFQHLDKKNEVPREVQAEEMDPRELQEEKEVVPGRGWDLSAFGDLPSPSEYCDGSTMSICGKYPGSTCLGLGHNDHHVGLVGSTLSGWLVFDVPKVKEGIILIRMEWWCGTSPKIAEGWEEVNDGKTYDTKLWNATDAGNSERRLGKPTPDQVVPMDLKMDIAINGAITRTMEREEWIQYIAEPSKNCATWPLMNDDEMANREDFEGENVEVAIRFRSEENPKRGFCISHLYYA